LLCVQVKLEKSNIKQENPEIKREQKVKTTDAATHV
jgi:hypothetical protein